MATGKTGRADKQAGRADKQAGKRDMDLDALFEKALLAAEKREAWQKNAKPSTTQNAKPSTAQKAKPSTAQKAKPSTAQKAKPSTTQKTKTSTKLSPNKTKTSKKLKTPCPADRVVKVDGILKCTSKKAVSKIKLGPLTAQLNRKNITSSPQPLKGIHAERFPHIAREIADNQQRAKACGSIDTRLKHQTFASPGAALDALYKANPNLGEAINRLYGSTIDRAYQQWLKHRQGPRPTLQTVTGNTSTANLPNIDFLLAYTDAKGVKRTTRRKVHSITEALYASTPQSRRWDDWMPVLLALQQEINEAAQHDEFIKPWHEIRIPGRAGAAHDQRRRLAEACAGIEVRKPAEILRRERAARGGVGRGGVSGGGGGGVDRSDEAEELQGFEDLEDAPF